MSKATFTAISGSGGKAPACFLLETPDARVLFDLGYGPRPGSWPDLSGVGRVDALVLSHGHGDHAGGLARASQVGDPPVYATAAVLATLDTPLAKHELPVRGTATVCGLALRTGRSGHAPGGVWLHVAVGDGLLYTGDYCLESLIYAYDAPPPAATLVMDASYGAYEVALADGIAQLAPLVERGAVLLPVPPRGRGAEIAYHLAQRAGIVLRLGDDLRQALNEMGRAPEANGLLPGIGDVCLRLAREAPPIGDGRGVMLAGPATGEGGEAGALLARWEQASEPAIAFTGYVAPGTPAQRLTDSGRARKLRWNVHPRLSDNVALVKASGARTVMPAFGDRCHRAAWERAFAPARVVLDEAIDLQ